MSCIGCIDCTCAIISVVCVCDRDDRSTTFYMLGSVSSESVLPMVMGMAMRAAEAGDRVLMFIIVFITCVLIVLYHIIAFLLSNSIRGTKAS